MKRIITAMLAAAVLASPRCTRTVDDKRARRMSLQRPRRLAPALMDINAAGFNRCNWRRSMALAMRSAAIIEGRPYRRKR